ncbi:MAG: thioredoxin family protein [Bacteroidetes bacterium]|nr:thioredoxin family protein [Bacteroidota bacterium]MBU1577915.1 thioredoxin family protein [Bacteroidota bacterium]MBU2465593.1 thioredoxin family protein [Bacteroidota bacterium]MBU2558728.1 thioredoxin family protein [Bacteroidota bacterium]
MSLQIKLLLSLIFFTAVGQIKAQEIDQYMMDTLRNREVLIDFVTREGLQSGEFASYYESEYADYEVDGSVVSKLKANQDGLEIVIVLASWCHDSKIQVPRFLKLLDTLAFSEEQLLMIAVDSYKNARTLDIHSYEIERVPTFIFYRNGTELGRIIESPDTSLEADMLRILQ